MERFSLEKHWQDFINGETVINCKSIKLASEFLDYCQNKKGLLWWGEDKPIKRTYWNVGNENTCYRFAGNRIRYENIDYYDVMGYTILSFEGFENKLEVFDLDKHWNDFEKGKIAVNCSTEELAKEFLEYCEDKGLHWDLLPETYYYHYKENTYYTCIKNNIKFGDIKWFKDNGDLIVEFKGFKSNITYDPNIDYQAILNANPNMLESERDILIDKRNIKIWGNILKKPKANLVVTKENIEVIYNGNETIVIIRDGKRFYKVVAKCSPEDTYDKEIGFQTAYSRAREKQNGKRVIPFSNINTTLNSDEAELNINNIYEKLYNQDVNDKITKKQKELEFYINANKNNKNNIPFHLSFFC